MYGRENRLKVSQDEAKYEEEQAAVRERAADADRERRRQLLLERARQRYGVSMPWVLHLPSALLHNPACLLVLHRSGTAQQNCVAGFGWQMCLAARLGAG